jgi:UDP-N-acetylmuramoyl-L-alanyl-D-glutamate--2,6-diaminopimelate ligase
MNVLLQDVLYKVAIRSVEGPTNIEVNDIQIDSRKVSEGSLFVAVRGVNADGHAFIEDVITKGAKAIICEQLPAERKEGIVWLQVAESSVAAAIAATNFYNRPSEKLQLVGVTGTNGKTTIATLLYKLFTRLGYTCGLISTVQNMIGKESEPSQYTTPDAVSLNALLKRMVDSGCSRVFMEVSSHAVHQHRVTGLQFSGGIFSNITHDHLDYHKTFDEYIRVKKAFFDSLPRSAFAISNADDKRGAVMLQNCNAKKYFYSLKTLADFKGKILDNNLEGLQMTINDIEVHFRLIGEFNAYNLLAVYGAAVCLGEDKQEILTGLSSLDGAEGRFEQLISPNDKLMAIIDYAHTPDALLNVLSAIKKLRKGTEKLITVVGCGGDRDKTKRPLMAEVVCEHSDRAIFTSDNPRSEDPEAIIADMEKGLLPAFRRKYISITDRKEAIKAAIMMANPEDIILIAGKGHEKYQEIKGVRNHFDDKEIVKEIFGSLNK